MVTFDTKVRFRACATGTAGTVPVLSRKKNGISEILTYWCLECCGAVVAATDHKCHAPQSGPSVLSGVRTYLHSTVNQEQLKSTLHFISHFYAAGYKYDRLNCG